MIHRRKRSRINSPIIKSTKIRPDRITGVSLSSVDNKREYLTLLFVIIVICTLICLVHWPVLSSQAFYIDDNQYISTNLLVQNPSWQSACQFFKEIWHPSTVEGYYQPLSMVSLMIDYAFIDHPTDLSPFHRTNLVLHIFNTALIIVLLYHLFGKVWIAGVITLAFGLHPMTVEPVAWISDRKTLLTTFFSIICIILYILWTRHKKRSLYLLCISSYVLAALSKPTCITIPLLLIILDYWLLKRKDWGIVREKLPFFIIAIFFAVITYVSQSGTAGLLYQPFDNVGTLVYVLVYNIFFYLFKIIWPVGLPHYYLFPETTSFTNPNFVISSIGSCAIVIIAVFSLYRNKNVFFGLLFFFIALLPTIQFFGFTYVIISDKFAYLPSIGLLIMSASFLINRDAPQTSEQGYLSRHLRLLALALLPFISFEVIKTRQCLRYWANTLDLYEYLIKGSPEAPVLHNNFANILRQKGDLDQAINHYRKTLEIKPDDYEAHNNIGITLKSKGLIDEAVQHLEKAIFLKPDFAQAYCNMGVLLKDCNKENESLEYYTKALEYNPNLIEARINRSFLLISKGKQNEAINDLQYVFSLSKNIPEAYHAMGMIQKEQLIYEEAINHFKKALELRPGWADIYYELGDIYTHQRIFKQAMLEFGEALKLEPDRIDVRIRMADISSSTGNETLAVKYLSEVLDIDPNHLATLCRLIVLRSVVKSEGVFNPSEAVTLAEKACQITEYRDAGVLDLLAVAYASGGEYSQAIDIAEKAIQLAEATKKPDMVKKIEKRLETYKRSVGK